MTLFDHSYAYSAFIVFFGAVWLCVYVLRKDLRNEMLRLSLLCAPLGVLGEYFARQDYYFLTVAHPTFWMMEAALIGFVYGGSAVAVYAAYRHIYFKRRHYKMAKHPVWFLSLLVGGSLAMYLGMQLFHVNSVYISITVMLLGGLSIVYSRRDLLSYAFGSGVLMMLLSLVFYSLFQLAFMNAIEMYWNTSVLSWGYLWGTPVEELVWAFAWGFLVGPSYEFEFTARPRFAKSK